MAVHKLRLSPSIQFPKRKRYTLHARKYRITLGQKTRLMAILNITPDSFSGDGCLRTRSSVEEIVELAYRKIKEGADILDIGGESTRPGASPVSTKEEAARVIPIIKKIAKTVKCPISVDTHKLHVAKAALDAGASIVNNIQGVTVQKNFLEMVRRYRAAIVLMHMRGLPQTMQKNIQYKNVVAEIIAELKKSVEKCLEIGIKSDRIIIDPGIGFGKTVFHNLEIIRRFNEFSILDVPLLIGTSRKSFIGKILQKDTNNRVFGTAASVSATILNGAHFVRVHNVAAMKDVIRLTDAVLMPKKYE